MQDCLLSSPILCKPPTFLVGKYAARGTIARHIIKCYYQFPLLSCCCFSEIHVHPVIKGQHVHQPELISIIQDYDPSLLIILDQGSRRGAIVPGLTTLLIDHHKPEGFPEGATVSWGWGGICFRAQFREKMKVDYWWGQAELCGGWGGATCLGLKG